MRKKPQKIDKCTRKRFLTPLCFRLEELDELYAEGATLDVDGQCLQPLLKLRSLRKLSVARTKIGDAAVAVICQIPHLVELDVHTTAITDKGIQTLTSIKTLRRLDLSGTRITDASLATLGKFGELESLNVSLTNVTPEGVAALKAQCPNLEVICDTAAFAP